MRITLLANQDLASNLALNKLISALPQHQYLVLLSAKVGSEQTRPKALRELAFFEQTLFNQILFPALSQRPDAGGELLSFNQLASSTCRVRQVEKADLFEAISAATPDLIISIRFGFILSPSIIALAKRGVINLHSGVLPTYRGVMATFWAMLNDESEIGTSLHFIEDIGIDTGALIKIDKRPLDKNRSYLANMLSLYDQGVQSVCRTVADIEQGRQVNTIPRSGEEQYFSFPTNEDIQRFTDMGLTLVDPDDVLSMATKYF